MDKDSLIAFEERVRVAFEAGHVKGPVHLSGGNEEQLIEIFREVKPTDWVFSTWRNHYHALLHGIDPDWVMNEIIEGRSLSLNNAAHRFYTSAIVGGILPIAVGVAAAIKRSRGDQRVWCFVGDMCALGGACMEATQYAASFHLPLRIVIEDNGYSTGTPTHEAWNTTKIDVAERWADWLTHYRYERTVPHYGSGKAENL